MGVAFKSEATITTNNQETITDVVLLNKTTNASKITMYITNTINLIDDEIQNYSFLSFILI